MSISAAFERVKGDFKPFIDAKNEALYCSVRDAILNPLGKLAADLSGSISVEKTKASDGSMTCAIHIHYDDSLDFEKEGLPEGLEIVFNGNDARSIVLNTLIYEDQNGWTPGQSVLEEGQEIFYSFAGVSVEDSVVIAEKIGKAICDALTHAKFEDVHSLPTEKFTMEGVNANTDPSNLPIVMEMLVKRYEPLIANKRSADQRNFISKVVSEVKKFRDELNASDYIYCDVEGTNPLKFVVFYDRETSDNYCKGVSLEIEKNKVMIQNIGRVADPEDGKVYCEVGIADCWDFGIDGPDEKACDAIAQRIAGVVRQCCVYEKPENAQYFNSDAARRWPEFAPS